MKKRFTEAQIIGILKEAEAGGKKSRYGGLTVSSEVQRLKALESENSKLKRLLAESLLDNDQCAGAVGRVSRATAISDG